MNVKQKNLTIYGEKPIPWSRALEQLDAGFDATCWLATTRPDGRPHVAGIGALWREGRFYIVTGAGTRKGRNLAKNPNCVISLALKGLDPRDRGLGGEGHGQRDAPPACEGLCRSGMARDGERRRVHRPVQRAERRATALGPLHDHPADGVRRCRGGAARGHSLAIQLSSDA